jgi:hypothetical protein
LPSIHFILHALVDRLIEEAVAWPLPQNTRHPSHSLLFALPGISSFISLSSIMRSLQIGPSIIHLLLALGLCNANPVVPARRQDAQSSSSLGEGSGSVTSAEVDSQTQVQSAQISTSTFQGYNSSSPSSGVSSSPMSDQYGTTSVVTSTSGSASDNTGTTSAAELSTATQPYSATQPSISPSNSQKATINTSHSTWTSGTSGKPSHLTTSGAPQASQEPTGTSYKNEFVHLISQERQVLSAHQNVIRICQKNTNPASSPLNFPRCGPNLFRTPYSGAR